MQCCLLADHNLTGFWTCSGTLAASLGGLPAPRCAPEQHSGRAVDFCSLPAEAEAQPRAATSRSSWRARMCAGRRGRRGQGDADAHPQRRPQVPDACGPLVEGAAASSGAPDVPTRYAAALPEPKSLVSCCTFLASCGVFPHASVCILDADQLMPPGRRRPNHRDPGEGMAMSGVPANRGCCSCWMLFYHLRLLQLVM